MILNATQQDLTRSVVTCRPTGNKPDFVEVE